jgi:hypothetical protein
VLASMPGALQAAANASRVDPLANLLAGTSIPDAASLQITGSGGGLSMSAVSIDQTGGDPTYLPVNGVQPYLCSTPGFQWASASPVTLVQPGPVTLSWNSQLADSVDISAGASGQPSTGFITLPVTASTAINLVAHNSCGSTTAVVNIFVGPPQVKSAANFSNPPLSSTTAASGAPGQAIALQIGNIADLTTVSAILFKRTDGQIVGADVLDATSDGNVLVRIPFWPATAAPGYRTGNFTLSAVIGGVTTGAIPFTIAPLAYSGDPIADFGALLNGVAADGNSVLAGLIGTSGYAAISAAQKQAAAGLETILRKMLSDITASGSATIPADLNPQGATMKVSKADLTTFMGYLQNIGAPTPPPPLPIPRVPRPIA